MATIGRKNVHGKGGVRFKAGYTASKDKAMLRNVASQLIVSGKVVVTAKVAKQLQKETDHLVTLAKAGDLHSRRLAAAYVRDGFKNSAGKSALEILFSDVAAAYKDRNGGYTRILKMVNRKGDNAPMAMIEFVK